MMAVIPVLLLAALTWHDAAAVGLPRPAKGTKKSNESPVDLNKLFKPSAKQEGRNYNGDNIVNVCFYCDSYCRQTMWQSATCNSSPETFFDDVIADANTMMASLSVGYVLQHHATLPLLTYDSAVNMGELAGSNTGIDALSAIMEGFFTTPLVDWLTYQGCEATFLLGDFSDPVISTFTGASYMFGMCTENSYGLLKLSLYSSAYQASSLVHEIGHMIGCFHDEPVHPDYADSEAYLRATFGDAQMDALNAACNAPDHDCHDLTGQCLMTPLWFTQSVPMTFSGCSREYVSWWPLLAITWPNFYESSCVIPGTKKRNVEDSIVAVPTPPLEGIADGELEFVQLADVINGAQR